ncbi:MAG: CDP-alcohol phosphatidyltransferase family protein [Rhizobiaceae bacterium]
MFDTSIRSLIDPALNRTGAKLASLGVSANWVTWLGFVIGLLATISIANHHTLWGLVLLLLSRLCDGLDGAIAKATKQTDLGGFLDIVLDFAFYGMIPLAFIIANPVDNSVAGGVLMLLFYVNGASFLTYALVAEKQGLTEQERGNKSLLYTVGLAEATETIAVFALMCLFPHWFSTIAYVFAAVVLVTTMTRFTLAYRTFSDPD